MVNESAREGGYSIPRGYSNPIIQAFFWIGIVSAVIFRALIIVEHYDPSLSKRLWYVGVVGYLLFFAHRYNIANRRYSVVKELGLLGKIENRERLDQRDYEGLKYVMWSISVSKERTNYIIISAISVAAIAVSIMLNGV